MKFKVKLNNLLFVINNDHDNADIKCLQIEKNKNWILFLSIV